MSRLLFLTAAFTTLSASGTEEHTALLQQLSEADPAMKFAAAQELAQMDRQNPREYWVDIPRQRSAPRWRVTSRSLMESRRCSMLLPESGCT
jgi:hypothetical protein